MTATEPLGLRNREVVVVPYDARWPLLFETASAELIEALGSSIFTVHHVGSTSVPGLCAKPVLDLLVSVPHLEAASVLVSYIEPIGYEFRPGEDIPDRLFFRRRVGTVRTHHLSLAEPTSRHHTITLAFRDALRRNPQLAASYADLKLALAQRFPRNRPAYLEGKSEFIDDVLARTGTG